jgi:glycosyltransferase involved in cell wall biosynthesis
MRVGVVSPWRLDDPAAWSGIVRPMYEALAAATDVVPIHLDDSRHHVLDRAATRLLGAVGRGYLPGHALATSRSQAPAAEEAVRSAGVDVVLSVAASTPLAFAHLDVPVVEVSDATFGLITGYYPMFTGLHAASRRQGEVLARRTAHRAAGFLMASQWAAASLRERYGVDPARIRVAPFGPSVTADRPPAGPRPGEDLRVLFVGTDWVRKGGDAAVAAVALARESGLGCELTVVGDGAEVPHGVRRLGRVPRERMPALYAGHDVLLETARANAGGVTLTDATASGLPVVATRTGGVPSIVDDGVTGILVDPTRVVPGAAESLRRLADGDVWRAFSDAAVRRGRDVLSWNRWAETATELCAEVVAARR